MSAPESVLLDTSVVVEHLRFKNPAIAQKLNEPRILYLPLIARAELLFGAHASSAPKVLKESQQFFRTCTLLLPSEGTSDIYARVGADLRRKGRNIPSNDLWIAAMALEYDLPLFAHDIHFSYVPGLTVLPW